MGTVELVSQAYCDENPYTGHTPDSIAIIAAYPNYGYHFSHWSDGDTTNPRSVYATQDSILFAYFEPNDYTITVQNEHIDWGSVVGNTVYQYLDTVVIEAVPTEHYHFLHWSQEHGYYEDYFYYNPLSFVITQDTIFQAQGRISVDPPPGGGGGVRHPNIFMSLYMKNGKSATPRT